MTWTPPPWMPPQPPRKGLRCLLGFHAWDEVLHQEWECLRCWAPAPSCPACGGQHDPRHVTICITTIGGTS